MKLIAAVVLAFASSVTADFNLRAKGNKVTVGNDKAEARIVVHGLIKDASDEDLQIIGKMAVNAYNKAYQQAGYAIDGYKAELTASDIETVGFNYDCRFCPPDDDSTAFKETAQLVLAHVNVGFDGESQAANLAAVHRNFEASFCADLRASGSTNLAKVRDCSFSFLDMPGAPDRNIPIVHQGKASKAVQSEVQVMIGGIKRDVTPKDLAVIDKAITEAYNDVYASAGYSIKAYETEAGLTVPTEGDSAQLLIGTVGTIGWSYDCRFCPPDDDATAFATQASHAQLGSMHQAFETAFCNKLKKSGLSNLENAHGCSFRFVHNAALTEMAVQKS